MDTIFCWCQCVGIYKVNGDEGRGKIYRRFDRTDSRFTNGEVRMRVYDGSNEGVYKWTFAGNAHGNFQAGVLRDSGSMRLGNFDAIIQGTRRNKIKERLRGERNLLLENGNGKK